MTFATQVTIFGHGLVQHAVVAVTHAMEKNKRLLDRTELFDEISKLPPKASLVRVNITRGRHSLVGVHTGERLAQGHFTVSHHRTTYAERVALADGL